MLMVNQLIGFGVGSEEAPTLSYRTTLTSGSNATNYTFAATDIGTAAANRKVIVAAWADSSAATPRTHNSLTIGGVSANLVTSVTDIGTAACITSLWELDVASGSTADIVLSTSGGNVRCGIAVWAAYGCAQSSARDTATSVADPADLSVDTLSGGFVVAFAGATGGSAPSNSWTGLTERSDQTIESGGVSAADSSGLSASTPLTISANYSVTPDRATGVSAAWR